MKIALVVEDEPLTRFHAEDMLSTLGYSVLGIAQGDPAIALGEALLDLHLLVTDIDLGPGPTGWEVAARLRSRHPGLEVIYMSGHAGAEDLWRHGVAKSSFLAKPYGIQEFATAVRSAMEPVLE